ncbi:MAG: hypothetical protein L3J75_11735 [Methylococcaceae bacterium]|nr:hypothetical protein [Methylococcaceae bacterium]
MKPRKSAKDRTKFGTVAEKRRVVVKAKSDSQEKKTGFRAVLKTLLIIFRSIIITVIALIYPYLVYRGIQDGGVWLAPSIIAAYYLYQAFHSTSSVVRIKKLLTVLVLLMGVVYFQAITAKIIPVFIQLTLMNFFGKTLLDGKGPPLIERFVRLEFPEFPPGIDVYCRQLTILWTGFFAFNSLVCIGLALWAPASWWALYTGIGLFVLTVLLMVGEYIWRHFWFPELDIPDVKSSTKNMIINGRQIWKDVHAS